MHHYRAIGEQQRGVGLKRRLVVQRLPGLRASDGGQGQQRNSNRPQPSSHIMLSPAGSQL